MLVLGFQILEWLSKNYVCQMTWKPWLSIDDLIAQLPEDEQNLIKMITNFLVIALVSELIVLESIEQYIQYNILSLI